MKKYKIPLEVQIEDRIFGPITMRRLIILTIGGGLTYIIFRSLQASGVAIWGVPTFIFGTITIALAFVEPFGMRFGKFILRMVEFLFLPRQRLWDKRVSQDIMWQFYANQHQQWNFKNAKKVPTHTAQQKKAEQREHLSQFSPLLDLDLSEIQVPKKTKKSDTKAP